MIIDYSEESILQISFALKNHQNVCIPTDTVYGLIAASSSEKAVRNIFKLKKRSFKSPLAMLCKDINQAKKYIIHSDLFEKLSVFWPGALTLICKQNPSNNFKTATSGLDTIGIRVPKSEIIHKIIDIIQEPIFATSVNISGTKPIQNPIEMDSLFGNKILILRYLNEQNNQIPSTIIDISNKTPFILRDGLLTKDNINNIVCK